MAHKWVEEEDRRILEHVAQFGGRRGEIAAMLGVSLKTLEGHIEQRLRGRWKDAVAMYKVRMRAQEEVAPVSAPAPRPSKIAVADILEMPPKVFDVPLGFGVTPVVMPSEHNFTALLHGDAHAPFEDPKVMALVKALTRELQPNTLVNMGDLVDCYEISTFGKDPKRLSTLQDAVDQAAAVNYQIRNASPNSAAYLLEGNHEDRLRRLLENLEGGARQLPLLRNVDRELQWPRLLDLDGAGTQWVPLTAQPKTDIVPKIVIMHGDLVSQDAGYTARREMLKYGKSGASGHTHRLATFKKNDLNGVSTWIETGCTCLLHGQAYGQHFNWQNAAVFIEWNPDRRIMQEHLISFRDGRAFWRGTEYNVNSEPAVAEAA